MEFLMIMFALPLVVAAIDFFNVVFFDRDIAQRGLTAVIGPISVLLYPVLYLLAEDVGQKNDCCNETAFFSPAHRLRLYILILLCMAAYFFSLIRRTVAPPLMEVMVNCLLIIGIALNVLLILHIKESWLWALGNIPIILLFIMALLRNHAIFLDSVPEDRQTSFTGIHKIAWRLLTLPAFQKLPVLVILCLPLLVLLAAVLLLFGQKPDSIIRAFTDTYKQGLSQLDHQCEGVVCPGHYLCTIAAKGHPHLVKPLRTGVRAGRSIICNRQLLIANAFEEWLEQEAPFLHQHLRKHYNKIGGFLHRHYHVFNHKWVSDAVYIMMKPLEWGFILFLYLFDKSPEDRIAVQYLSADERSRLKNLQKDRM